VTKQSLTNSRLQRTKNRENTEETQTNTQRPQQTTNIRSKTRGEHLQPYNPNRGQPNANQQLDLLKETTPPKVRRSATQSRWQSIHPTDQQRRQSIRPKRIEAKRQGGKTSARAAQRQSIRQQTTNATWTMQSKLSEGRRGSGSTRRRANDHHRQEHPRQRLQGGSDAKGAIVIRPTWSRFSPGKLRRA